MTSIAHIHGYDAEAFLQSHQQPKEYTTVRFNEQKPLKENTLSVADAVPWCNNANYLYTRPQFTLDPAWHAGAYYVQEASSMMVGYALKHFLPIEQPLTVLDMCAAPGGKSTHIDSILSNESTLVANEVIGTRNAILQENITKWGSHKVIVIQNDAKDIGKCETMFDAIVIDAPCSGSGLFRRDNNAIVEWSEQNVQLCSERQQRIIAELLPALKPNGLLLYSTCSYSPKENEDVVDWLTSTFSLKSLSIPIEATWGISSIETAGHNICYRFWPHLVKGEGFFMAALQNSDALSKEWNKQKAKNNLGISKQQQQCIESLQFEYAFAPHYFEHANNIFVTNERTLLTIQQLKQYLHIKKAGVKLGQVTKYDIIPEHELALAAAIQLPYNIIELEKVAALKYLKKVELELIGAKNGWNLIQQNGVNLGFIKYLGNRYNNYYPKNWRIRMDIE